MRSRLSTNFRKVSFWEKRPPALSGMSFCCWKLRYLTSRRTATSCMTLRNKCPSITCKRADIAVCRADLLRLICLEYNWTSCDSCKIDPTTAHCASDHRRAQFRQCERAHSGLHRSMVVTWEGRPGFCAFSSCTEEGLSTGNYFLHTTIKCARSLSSFPWGHPTQEYWNQNGKAPNQKAGYCMGQIKTLEVSQNSSTAVTPHPQENVLERKKL